MPYTDPEYRVTHEHRLTGNDAATLLLTPQAGTAAATKTHTTTCVPWMPGRKITLKKLSYHVTTAQTGAGNNLTLNVYNGTTSVGTLSVTTQTAGTLVAQAADMEVDLDADDYLRVIALSLTTASDANSAVGQMAITYQQRYA